MSILNDLKFILRTFKAQLGPTITAVLSLSLGVAASSTILAVLDNIQFRPVPFSEPEKLVMLLELHPENPSQWISPRNGKIAELSKNSKSFKSIGMVDDGIHVVLSDRESSQRVRCQRVDSHIFNLLGISPILGRSFYPEEVRPGQQSQGLVISYRLWQERFSGSNDVLSEVLSVNGASRPVIGVMPPNFWILPWRPDVDLWEAHNNSDRPNGRWMLKIARLDDHISLDEARSETETIFHNWDLSHGFQEQRWNGSVWPLRKAYYSTYDTSVYALLGAGVILLLISSINLASIMLVRTQARVGELSVRIAAGANRRHVIQLLLTETLLLALMASAVAIGLIVISGRLLVSIASSQWTVPLPDGIGIDGRILAITLGIATATAVVFGFLPVLGALRRELGLFSPLGGRSVMFHGLQWKKKLLLISEVSLASALLFGAGIVFNGYIQEIRSVQGFNPNNVLSARVELTGETYWSRDSSSDVKTVKTRTNIYWSELMENVRSIAGVEAAGLINPMPQSPWSTYPFSIVGDQTVGEDQDEQTLHYHEVDEGIFESLQIPLLRGRYLSEKDLENSRWALVVDQTFVKRYLGDRDPIGTLIRLSRRAAVNERTFLEPRVREIVGVVPNLQKPFWMSEEPARAFGLFRQRPLEFHGSEHRISIEKTILLRTSVDPIALGSSLVTAANEVDRSQVVFDIMSFEDQLANSFPESLFLSQILGALAIVAVVLALIGIYGITSHSVSQRRLEIGIRLALGFSRTWIFGWILRDAFILVLCGLTFGITLGIGFRSVLDRIVFGLTSVNVMSLLTVSLILLITGLVAAMVPALRATYVDPLTSLRNS